MNGFDAGWYAPNHLRSLGCCNAAVQIHPLMSLVLNAGPLGELAYLTGMTEIHLSVIALKQITLFHNQLEIFLGDLHELLA